MSQTLAIDHQLGMSILPEPPDPDLIHVLNETGIWEFFLGLGRGAGDFYKKFGDWGGDGDWCFPVSTCPEIARFLLAPRSPNILKNTIFIY